ncbi:MAG: GWxTD domain-containing protein [Candidatus Aminicenantales bacterium]
MKKPALLGLLILLPGLLFPQAKIKEKDLPQQYQEWLQLVAYIIQPVERDVFMKLVNNRDRDIFIETFWKQRDPTPGTPENEYKNEIIQRFQYVNRQFGRGHSTTREGWRTDMGRIYMILGPPQSIEHFEASIGLVPCQSWSFYGDSRKNLPPQFILLFYQRGGIGEYKLYDPVSDGPARLLLDQKKIDDPMDYHALYEMILDIQPTLAEIAITRIPGEYNYDLSPSQRNNILLADILESPKKDVNPSYATHFLDYKGIVSTEYMTNFVESNAATDLIRDPMTGLQFLHFIMAPVNVSVDYYVPKSQYFCSYQVNVSLRVGEAIIFQYTRDFPIYIPDKNIDRIRANGIAVEDSFPIIDGKFKLIVLMTNSVGKEFSILEKDIVVSPDTGLPGIGGLYVGYRFETYQREIHVPFKVLDKKLVVDPRKMFGAADEIAYLFNIENLTEDLRANGEARIHIRGLRKDKPVEKSFSIKLSGYTFGRALSITQSMAAKDLDPDYYELTVSLVGGDGRVLDEKKDTFIVTTNAAIGHPIANAKGFALANQFLYSYMLAQQEQKIGQMDKAKALFEKAFNLNPDYKEGVVMFTNFLIEAKDFDRALELVERLRGDEKRQSEYFSLRGKILLGKGQYADALVSLTEANKIYNSDVQVLNALGMCYWKTGQKTKALDALNASLKLDPNQAEVKKLVAEISR